MPRCGTNFLYNLLALHPECYIGDAVQEDYLLTNADLLINYAQSAYRYWSSHWEVEKRIGPYEVLCRCLGDGLTSFLRLQAPAEDSSKDPKDDSENPSNLNQKRLITKTPEVRHLKYFFQLFPKAHLLILVRDGRSVTESGVKSAYWGYEKAMRYWAKAASDIDNFDDTMKEASNKYLIVRYEDLVEQTTEQLKKIFLFLGLSIETYNFKSAENLLVMGSSQLNRKKGNFDWERAQKPEDFNPLARHHHWSRKRHERFNWIAGDYLSRFGYTQKTYPHHRFLWTIWNIILDIHWGLKKGMHSILRKVLKKNIQKKHSDDWSLLSDIVNT